MGWGFNEDRNGARPRVGRTSTITGNVTGGNDPENLTTGVVSEVNFKDYCGTGPTTGQNGAVINFTIENPGLNFEVNTNHVYTNVDSDIHSLHNLFIEVTEIEIGTGKIISARVAWPGSGFAEGDLVSIYNGLGNTAIIKITNTGQSIDISNGFLGKTTGVLSRIYNQYKDHLIYIPSKGPESKNAQENTSYRLTGYMNTLEPRVENKNPEYINNFPVRSGDSGTRLIKSYITSQAIYVKRNPSTNVNWKLTNPETEIAYNPSIASIANNNTNLCATNGIAVILIDNTFSVPVTGNKYDGSYSRVTYQNSYNRFTTDGYHNSYNWEILLPNKDGVSNLITSSTLSGNINMKLTSLIIPNVTLDNKISGHLNDLSFLYVQINNESSSENIKGKLLSNNPQSLNALFKVSINNIFNKKNKKFVCLKGDDQFHKINFTTLNNIHIKVYCPNGELLKLSKSDTILPQPIDPELQMNVLFEIIQ